MTVTRCCACSPACACTGYRRQCRHWRYRRWPRQSSQRRERMQAHPEPWSSCIRNSALSITCLYRGPRSRTTSKRLHTPAIRSSRISLLMPSGLPIGDTDQRRHSQSHGHNLESCPAGLLPRRQYRGGYKLATLYFRQRSCTRHSNAWTNLPPPKQPLRSSWRKRTRPRRVRRSRRAPPHERDQSSCNGRQPRSLTCKVHPFSLTCRDTPETRERGR